MTASQVYHTLAPLGRSRVALILRLWLLHRRRRRLYEPALLVVVLWELNVVLILTLYVPE